LNLRSHVGLIKHLIALIQDKHVEVIKVENTFFDESKNSSWGSNNNMRGSCWIFENLFVFLDWDSTKNDSGSNVFEIFGESIEFLLDLESKLSDIAKDQSLIWLWVGFINLLQDSDDENSSFSHA
jgi:hypothetical protein